MAWQDDPVVKSPDAQGSPAAWQADQVVPTTSPDQFATPPSSVLQRLRQGVAAVTQYPAQEAPGEPETDQGATVKAIRQGWAAGLDPTGFAKTWAAINNGTSAMSNLNPLKGIADATVSRFLFDNAGAVATSSKAWYVVDDSKPWFQLVVRTPVSVEQETPTSGQSFERDVVRFKCSTRMIADHVDPRFVIRGSDGSV